MFRESVPDIRIGLSQYSTSGKLEYAMKYQASVFLDLIRKNTIIPMGGLTNYVSFSICKIQNAI